VGDEENWQSSAALYLDCLFEEARPGSGRRRAWLRPNLAERLFGLEQARMEATANRSYLAGRSRIFLWFLEFTLPGLQPPCQQRPAEPRLL